MASSAQRSESYGRITECTGQWIPRVPQLTFCYRPDGMLLRTLLPERVALARPPSSTSDQCSGNPSYPKVISELKRTGELGRRCRCHAVRYLNNIVEQDHRVIKRRVRASQGLRSFDSATRTIQGIETVNMIRKGPVRWLPKHDIAGQVAFVSRLFGLPPHA